MAGLRVLDRHAIDQDQGLLETAAAYAQIRLHARRATPLDAKARLPGQQIGQRGSGGAFDLLAPDHHNRTHGFGGCRVHRAGGDLERIQTCGIGFIADGGTAGKGQADAGQRHRQSGFFHGVESGTGKGFASRLKARSAGADGFR